VPVAAFTLVLLIGGFVLTSRNMVMLYALVAVGVTYVHLNRTNRVGNGDPAAAGGDRPARLAARPQPLEARAAGDPGREHARGPSGPAAVQGEMPSLPDGWHAETVLRSAYGKSFSGDFLIAAHPDGGRQLEVVLVDVSGKGAAAGMRALLLSGAFGGLLGAMAPDRFLPAANAYLLRQHWDEGFATAVHLNLDLDTGDYRVASAGHPPAAQFRAGSGRWVLTRTGGSPVLGVLDAVEFDGVSGRLEPGDALLLYTDGVVETPDRDLDTGIDRMLGHAERLVRGGFAGGAGGSSSKLARGKSDDRALVLIWRQ